MQLLGLLIQGLVIIFFLYGVGWFIRGVIKNKKRIKNKRFNTLDEILNQKDPRYEKEEQRFRKVYGDEVHNIITGKNYREEINKKFNCSHNDKDRDK